MSALDTSVPTVKVCEVCGREFTRKRYANGHLEGRKDWLARRACGLECGCRLGGRESHGERPAAAEHPPCVICGRPVERRADEAPYRWLARGTCGDRACHLALISRRLSRPDTISERERSRRRRASARASAPQPEPEIVGRRRPFERFPTPEGARERWSPVIDGAPPLPPVAFTLREPGGWRPTGLRSALAAHPDLALALAGDLTDSWMPFHTTAVGANTAVTRRARK